MENQSEGPTTCSSGTSTAYHGTVQGPVPHQPIPSMTPHAGPMLIKQEPGSYYPNTCSGQYPQAPPLPSARQEQGMGYPVIKQEMPDTQMRHYGAAVPPTTAHSQFQPGYFMDQIPIIGMGENGGIMMGNHNMPHQHQQQIGTSHPSGNGPISMPQAPIDPSMPNYARTYPDPRGPSPHGYPQQMYPQQHMQQQQHPPQQYTQQMSQQMSQQMPQQPEQSQKQQHPGKGTCST